jgi:phosphate starvation-inducible protein PhoH and related proteins
LTKRAKRSTKANPREERNQFLQQPHHSGRNGNSHGNNHGNNQNGNSFQSQDRLPKRKRVDLIPRSLAQEKYVRVLQDESQYIVFAMGPAGCGKTLLATQYAIKALREGEFDRIVITRPAVSVDEQHGFLPGSLLQKMEPWVLPILDVFKEHYHPLEVQKMMEDGTIEVSPLAYMRGRTFKNAIILADEMQNSTVSQTKMVLTRIGDGSRIVVTGDLNQHDRGYETNGLKDIVERLEERGSKGISVCRFDQYDVERHPVIEQVLGLYDDDGSIQ